MNNGMLYDLYLFVYSPGVKKLNKLSNLTMDDATKYAQYWLEMNKAHDYILVISGSNPWTKHDLVIEEKTVDWLLSEYAKLNKV